MPSLTALHQQWSRMDQQARLREGLVRLVSGAVILWTLHRGGVLPWPLLGGLGAGLLATEVARLWRDRRSLEDIAAHIDRTAQTGWLLQSALAAEAGTALGDPDVAHAVVQRALRLAPQVASLAIRPHRRPVSWLAAAVLSLVALPFLLSLRPLSAPASLAAGRRPSPAREMDPEATSAPPGAADPAAGERETADLPGAGGPGTPAEAAARGTLADQLREGAAGQGEGSGASGSGDPATQGSAREARTGQQSPAGAVAASSPESAPPPSVPAAVSLQASGQGTGEGEGGLRNRKSPGVASQNEGAGPGVLAAEVARPDGAAPPPGTPQEGMGPSATAAASGAERQLEGELGEHGELGKAESSSARTMEPNADAPAIASTEDERIWGAVSAGAGMGGINDAAATDAGTTAGERDRVAVTETRLESLWRNAPAGRVQAIAEGRAGGESQTAYEEVFVYYSELAEAVAADPALPPGRRDYIRRYFEAIRPPPMSPPAAIPSREDVPAEEQGAE